MSKKKKRIEALESETALLHARIGTLETRIAAALQQLSRPVASIGVVESTLRGTRDLGQVLIMYDEWTRGEA